MKNYKSLFDIKKYKQPNKFIVGGTKAKAKEFPHMAAIGFDTSDGIVWACDGTLISERFVLTAAHCTFNRNLYIFWFSLQYYY